MKGQPVSQRMRVSPKCAPLSAEELAGVRALLKRAKVLGQYVTAASLAKAWGVKDPDTLPAMCRRGVFSGAWKAEHGWMVPVSEVERYITARRVRVSAPEGGADE